MRMMKCAVTMIESERECSSRKTFINRKAGTSLLIRISIGTFGRFFCA